MPTRAAGGGRFIDLPLASFLRVTSSDWTTRLEVVVRADVESVFEWWLEPARQVEQRSFYEDLAERDELGGFSWVDRSEDGNQVSEARWVTRDGIKINFATSLRLPPDNPETDPDGRVLRQEIHQQRRLPNGREEVTDSLTILTFIPAPNGSTLVRLVSHQHKTGARWWERFLPPNDQRASRRKHLREAASRCEEHLANRP